MVRAHPDTARTDGPPVIGASPRRLCAPSRRRHLHDRAAPHVSHATHYASRITLHALRFTDYASRTTPHGLRLTDYASPLTPQSSAARSMYSND